MKDKRRLSGILLHPTSLPSPYGIGDLGEAAYKFVDFLATAGQHLWQILPLGPTGYGDSPYQSFSTFAGNPYYIDLERLIEDISYDASEMNGQTVTIDAEYVGKHLDVLVADVDLSRFIL